MWACLAGMAGRHKELSTAEIAYAAIEEVEKVQFINVIKEIPSQEGRNAGMALFCGQVKDAENILLQSGLIYRAIQMNIDQFNWDRCVCTLLLFCGQQLVLQCKKIILFLELLNLL